MRGWIALGVVLVIVWVFSFMVFKVAGFLIHLLLLLGLVLLIAAAVRRVRGRFRPR